MIPMDGPSQSTRGCGRASDTHASIAVQVRGLVKSFGSGETSVTVLKGIDLDVYFGELLLLVGESGGGKTTLLSAIAGILDIDAGNLEVLGASLTGCHQVPAPNSGGGRWDLSTNSSIFSPP